MSTCTKWVERLVISCTNWEDRLVYQCTEWSDQGSYECSEWADEGRSKCSEWADEGHYECDDWERKCSWTSFWNCVVEWVCDGWYYVANWVCQGWYWVAEWVCKAWYWVAKWVCIGFAWIVKAVCVMLGWFLRLVCVAWDIFKCFVMWIMEKGMSAMGAMTRNKPKIEHIFVLMLENRSYDHLLGFSDLKGIDSKTNLATRAEGVNPAAHFNVDPSTGNRVSAHTPANYSLKGVDKDPGHEFDDTVTQLCGNVTFSGGLYPPVDNSGFVRNYVDIGAANPKLAMSCFAKAQLPVLNALAGEFALCDYWFSSMPGPTFPNRFFVHAASAGGLDDSPDPESIVVGTTAEGFRFSNGTIFDAMDAKCIEWEIFEGDEFPVSFTLRGMNLNALQGRFTDFEEFREKVSRYDFDKKFVFIEPKYGKHDFGPFGPGDFTCGNSMHPLDDVTRGEKLIKDTYEAIRNSPHWNKSVLLILFDEHGGFYDHVAPPVAVPPGDVPVDSLNEHGFKFDQLGVRIPAIVVSPLINKGTIDHTVYDHTSLLATVERLFRMKNLTERDKAANDFLHLFTRQIPRSDAPATLPDPVQSNFYCVSELNESVTDLMSEWAELDGIKQTGNYRGKKVESEKVTHSQVGFNYSALLKVLQTAKYPERQQWIEEFRTIETIVDSSRFMTAAKLKLRFGVDVIKIKYEANKFAGRLERKRTRRDKMSTQKAVTP